MHAGIGRAATALADIPQVGKLLAGVMMHVDEVFAEAASPSSAGASHPGPCMSRVSPSREP